MSYCKSDRQFATTLKLNSFGVMGEMNTMLELSAGHTEPTNAKSGLLEIVRLRFRAFEAKFGRLPKPDEPLFFDESKNDPIKASLSDTRAQLAESARVAGIKLDPILRFLGLAPVEVSNKPRAAATRLVKRGRRSPRQPDQSNRNESGSSCGWKQFLVNERLHRRYGITHQELGMLSQVAFLGEARSARDLVLILKMIRQRNDD